MIKFFLAAFAAAVLSESDTTAVEEITVVEELKEAVVTSLRQDVKLVETPACLAVVKAQDYRKHSAITVSDVLRYSPGINMGGDGVWATNINVRGLNENRLVTLVDGSRIETATDLTASMSMFDVNDVDRVEVVKGAQSSLYGSGAMGGIVNVITKDGHFADSSYFGGSAVVGYASANNYFNPYLSLGAGGRKWYLRLSCSYGNANDVRTPKGILENSGFKSWNTNAKFGLAPVTDQLLKVQFQHNHSYDVGIPGGAAFTPKAEARYKDINRTLLDVSYEFKNLTESFTSLKFRGFYQSILRDVEMNPNTSTTLVLPNGNMQVTTPRLITPYGSHRTFGTLAQGTWKFATHNTLIAGVDVWRRNIGSSRRKYINVSVQKPDGTVVVSNELERGETPLPDASFTSAGIFAQDEMHLADNRLNITVGGRLDGIFVGNEECHDVDYILKNGEKQPLTSQRVTFEAGSTSELSWSANLGILYKIGAKTDLVFNAARSFRAASLEERFKYIDLTSKVQLGNPNLKPESAFSADLGVRHWGDKFNIQASVFLNRLTDMIVETNGQFIYRRTYDGGVDTLPALIYNNVDRALLYGVDISAGYTFNHYWNGYASASYTVGRDTDKNEWLPNIPPANGRAGVVFTYPKVGAINLSAMVAFARREGQIAPGEKATDGYYRIDLALNSKVFYLGRTTLQIFGGIDNLTDVAYTNFLSTNRSGINFEPGVNGYIKLCFAF